MELDVQGLPRGSDSVFFLLCFSPPVFTLEIEGLSSAVGGCAAGDLGSASVWQSPPKRVRERKKKKDLRECLGGFSSIRGVASVSGNTYSPVSGIFKG